MVKSFVYRRKGGFDVPEIHHPSRRLANSPRNVDLYLK